MIIHPYRRVIIKTSKGVSIRNIITMKDIEKKPNIVSRKPSLKSQRERTIVKTGIISIIANLVLVIFKVLIGAMSNSIAIITDAINNLSDALSSIITIIGAKFAGKAPDRKHPYGYGRIEHVTAFVVSAIVLYAGATAFIESIKKIINPVTPDYSTTTIIILSAGIVVKFALGIYVKKTGKKIHSDSLVASGTDAFNDAILSISVLTSAVIYIIWQIDVEAYVGATVSLFIIRTGIELIKESVNNILGARVESSLSHKIKKEIEEIIFSHQGVLQMHGFYIDNIDKTISLDIIIDFSIQNRENLYQHIYDEIQSKYKDYTLNIILDVDASD